MLDQVAQVSVIMGGPSDELLVNTFHYVDALGAAGNQSAQDIAAAFKAQMVPALKAGCTTSIAFHRTETVVVFGDTLGDEYIDSSIVGGGSHAGTMNNIWTTLIFKRYTHPRTRGNRGRFYLPGVATTYYDDDGTVTADAASTAILTASLVDLSIPAGNMSPCLFRRSDGTYVVITAGQLSTMVGVQRRRRLGVGA